MELLQTQVANWVLLMPWVWACPVMMTRAASSTVSSSTRPAKKTSADWNRAHEQSQERRRYDCEFDGGGAVVVADEIFA